MRAGWNGNDLVTYRRNIEEIPRGWMRMKRESRITGSRSQRDPEWGPVSGEKGTAPNLFGLPTTYVVVFACVRGQVLPAPIPIAVPCTLGEAVLLWQASKRQPGRGLF